MMIKGYTLIEILIVLAITAFLFSIGYTNYRAYAQRQALTATARAMQTDLRLAQEQAIAGSKPTGCILLNGYQFRVTSSSAYQLDALCTNGVLQVKQVTLPTGITMTSPNPNPIFFKSLAQGTNIPSGGLVTIVITQTGTTNTVTITVGSNGNIQ